MLQIRHEQLMVLRRAHHEPWLVEQAVASFPTLVAELGIDTLRSWVAEAYDEALAHGFVEEVEIGLFVTVAMMLGPGFPRDAAFPAGAAILSRPTAAAERARELVNAAIEHLRSMDGA